MKICKTLRWSIYIAELFKYVFTDTGARWADFRTTENIVMFNDDIEKLCYRQKKEHLVKLFQPPTLQ